MNNKFLKNIIFPLIGLICFVFTTYSFIKSLFNKNNTNNVNKEDWIEVPLLIEK
jgi:hypothetical protein